MPSLLKTTAIITCLVLSQVVIPSVFVPNVAAQMSTKFEAPHAVPAQNFLGADLMQSPLHRVYVDAFNDGHANTYRIETERYTYEARGTDQARQLIHEIKATEALRETSTIGAAANAAKERAANWVETPIRVVETIIDKGSEIGSVEDALLFVPKGAVNIVGDLASGVGEFGVTGVRLVKGAAGAKCSGFQCAEKAGKDIWSGVNSFVGKHAAARDIYQSIGVDPNTENKVIRRQVDRLAYADAYTSTAIKFGVSDAGIQYLSGYNRGLGYFNNAEFIGSYEDAYRVIKREKTALESWGTDLRAIENFYYNEAYTRTARSQMVAALGQLHPDVRTRFLHQAADVPTRFDASGQVKAYDYLAQMQSQGHLQGFAVTEAATLALTPQGKPFVPIVADYLMWTPDNAALIQSVANLSRHDPQLGHAEIHVLGNASALFKQNCERLGLSVYERS